MSESDNTLLMGRTSFIIQDDLEEWIEDRLTYGQSKSGWYRYAVGAVHNVDSQLDRLYEPHQYDDRADFIEDAVKEKIKRVSSDRSHDKG